MLDEARYSLPLTTFFAEKKYRVKLQDGQLVWDDAKPPYAENFIPIANVIAVDYFPKEDKRFVIHYAKRKKALWKHKSLTLNHSEPSQVELWVTTIQNRLKEFSHRPKHVLLFVNPYGGNRTALQQYEKHAKPLFKIAGVDVSVVVSQRQNQIRDLVTYQNFDIFDAVGCAGGDGTVSELINGLVLRECRERGIDPHDPMQELPKPGFPVGIIPGGSTNTTAYCLHGTTDVATAALNIIFGDRLGMDLVSVHNQNHLLRLFADVVSYGYLGDIAHYSEDIRWMGSARYEYTGFKKIMANKGYEGKITLLVDSTPNQVTKCYENCPECLFRAHNRLQESMEDGTWLTIDGKFFMVSGANLSCAGKRNPQGLAPFSHLGDGYMHLVMIRHSSVTTNLRTLQRFTSSTESVLDLPHVEVHRTREFRFRAGSAPGRWNCDGEVLPLTDIRARVHCQLLNVLSRGVSRPGKNNKQCCRF